MTNGYVAFLLPRSWQEKMTARLDGGRFCHCELMFEQNDDGTWKTVSSLPKTGVRLRHVTLEGSHWVKVPVVVDADLCKAWYALHTGQNYDWLGLVTTKLPFINGHKGKWFCSELVAALLGLSNAGSYGIEDLYRYVKQ
ncbi:hypothetical protein A9308_00535 [Moraxella atlantae]|uniref:Enoyl-CoA hydratase n=1 Tax=Faucicola atlantae TaxID=34059 RepID=A0A1B8Q948_9GAMM|nr:hypothetical protein [Moraxella atlantae]OBX73730.1 hypothetical protein A9308_00535 [Moraxella atlantae]